MTATALATDTVHLAVFPAEALAFETSWRNHKSAHKAVMGLFPAVLPGDDRSRRVTSGILYRLDQVAGQARVIVQSTAAPSRLPDSAQHRTIDPQTWRHETGQRLMCRVAVNPIRRSSRNGERVIEADEVQDWLQSKIASGLTIETIGSHSRDALRGDGHSLVTDTLDFIATVNDPDALIDLRINGVGRAKAYGCGLLTTIAM